MTKKANGLLRAELARLLRRTAESMKWIHTPRKYEGSVVDGYRLFNALFARRDPSGRPHGLIHPRCKHLIAAADTAGRFEVSPVLRQLFDADEVALVEAEYQRLLDDTGDAEAGDE